MPTWSVTKLNKIKGLDFHILSHQESLQDIKTAHGKYLCHTCLASALWERGKLSEDPNDLTAAIKEYTNALRYETNYETHRNIRDLSLVRAKITNSQSDIDAANQAYNAAEDFLLRAYPQVGIGFPDLDNERLKLSLQNTTRPNIFENMESSFGGLFGEENLQLTLFPEISNQIDPNRMPRSSDESSIFSFNTSLYNGSSIAPSSYLEDGLTWMGSMENSTTRFGPKRWVKDPNGINLKAFFSFEGDYRTMIDERNQTVTFLKTHQNGNNTRVRTHRSNIATRNLSNYNASPLWDTIVEKLAGSRTGTLYISYGKNQGWVIQNPTQEQANAERMSLDGSYSEVYQSSSIASESTASQGERTPTPNRYAQSTSAPKFTEALDDALQRLNVGPTAHRPHSPFSRSNR